MNIPAAVRELTASGFDEGLGYGTWSAGRVHEDWNLDPSINGQEICGVGIGDNHGDSFRLIQVLGVLSIVAGL